MRSTKHLPSPYLRGTLYPNGELSIGFNPQRSKPRKPIKPYTAALPDWANGSERKYWEIRRGVERAIARESQSDSIGLSTPLISHKRSKKGSKGINSKEKIRARNYAHLLSESAPTRTLSFLTLTIPAVNDQESALINSQWSNIVRTFLQWLKRQLQATGLTGDYVSVTEIQEQRFLATGQLPLHLHTLFQGRKTPFTQWVLNPVDIRNHWLKLLSNAVGRKLESTSSENLQMVKGNAGAYLAKYLTKGSKVIQEVKKQGLEAQLPTAWINTTDNLKKRLKKETKVITDRAYLILRYREVLTQQKMIAYSRDIYLPGTDNYSPKLIGVYIKFQDLRAFYEALDYIAHLESGFNRNSTDVSLAS